MPIFKHPILVFLCTFSAVILVDFYKMSRGTSHTNASAAIT